MPGAAPEIVDAHAHCGVMDRSAPQSFEEYRSRLAGTPIAGAALFSPVAEIYDRWDFGFVDTPAWRERRAASNAYLAALDPPGFVVYPYFFVWNDFAAEQLEPAHRGVKWHRHADEPVYRYDDPRCGRFLEEIRRRRLPVVLEEELENTVRFVRELAAGIVVIVPHLGMLNGGFGAIAREGLWELEHVWADTALASPGEIRAYVERYGHERLLFGSDYPFGRPAAELEKVRRVGFPPEVEAAVLGGNFHRLQNRVADPRAGLPAPE